MKFLSLTTIFTLLFFSGAVMAQGHENGEQRNQTAAQERLMDSGHQRPLYSQDQYDSRYDEGVRRGKQAREEELIEERKQELKEKKERQKKQEQMK